MKTFIADIIPRIQKFSEKLDNLTLLTNQHWVVVDEIANSKTLYIFRQNNELLISKNGKVEKGKWEYLGNSTLLIDIKEDSYLFRHGFFDENVLALKIDGREEYALLVNESRYDKELNSPERVLGFLQQKYIGSKVKFPIQDSSKGKLAKQPLAQKPRVVKPKSNRTPVFIQNITTGESRYIAYFEWEQMKQSGLAEYYKLVSINEGQTNQTFLLTENSGDSPPTSRKNYIKDNSLTEADRAPILIQEIATGKQRYIACFEWKMMKKSGESIHYVVKGK